MAPTSTHPSPVVAAVTLGYGHLRAAAAIADGLGVKIEEVDRRPAAGPGERALWTLARSLYVALSRLSRTSIVGPASRGLLDRVTAIPDGQRPASLGRGAVLLLDLMIRRGLGRRFAQRVGRSGSPVVCTFYAPALAADRRVTTPVACLVTDSDAHRVWGPRDPASSRLVYLAPTSRVVTRLASWGVPPERIILTGFPLPPELVDPGAAAAAFARRTARLTTPARAREVPRLTVAVGGAGAQAERGRQLSVSLAPLVKAGRLRLAMVAGTNTGVAASFRRGLREAGLDDLPPDQVELLWEPSFIAYYRRFNRLLADTDILWTKPSELSFYAALGIALVLDDPVGDHERHNRDWLLELGAAVVRQDPDTADRWIPAWLEDGTLTAVASNGFRRLPRSGTARIVGFLQTEFTRR
jgi:UDP-N-acetylglucosamine:LPS N-acetylglucosamine transferase